MYRDKYILECLINISRRRRRFQQRFSFVILFLYSTYRQYGSGTRFSVQIRIRRGSNSSSGSCAVYGGDLVMSRLWWFYARLTSTIRKSPSRHARDKRGPKGDYDHCHRPFVVWGVLHDFTRSFNRLYCNLSQHSCWHLSGSFPKTWVVTTAQS